MSFLFRQSRFEDFYDSEDGDWGWFSTNIDEDREQFFTLTVPETPDEFYFYYFSIRSNSFRGFLICSFWNQNNKKNIFTICIPKYSNLAMGGRGLKVYSLIVFNAKRQTGWIHFELLFMHCKVLQHKKSQFSYIW